ncbi:replication initiation factor domain-containing protein [Bacillus paralicheniformis]|uniref:replication initiation factor domain-containing protein n=1 Tax=Bacillus paralicheniformis TaxID=1648923 RepID=UPI002DBDBDF0|nr:replication initiation factor domain-containing protein [Bacillus paralicheniformis]MEC1053541.1 replication initiation factor domain-containing protein [Bacillus paralicheniformis]MEC1088551.1 replication initiation factor domain-containing protein [Bacillus paralicheniformis]MEC1104901.1 replication initiation factor domain-containing protein [Bacillus paralicheniformis]MEC1112150.1 replication initiation factor domain-containing protein [Bacillus paralicheniformis]MEC1141154.1 replicatio
MTELKNPPHANRGVAIVKEKNEAVENPLTSMIDYIRVTFKTHDVDRIIENVLHISKDFMAEKSSGFYGYVGTYELDYIKVMYSAPGDNRGVLIELSGQGCRQFESFLKCRKKTWFDFFQDCLHNGGSFTRLDLAIDDKKTYFSIPELLKKAQKGECISRFRKSDFNGSFSLADGETGGTTIYFGSKQSDAYLCFYEKNYEQAEKYDIPLEDLGDWNRYELRLKNDRSQSAVKALMKTKDLTLIAMQIINNYVRFVDADENVTREHWKTSLFWSEFIGDVGKLHLFMKPQKDLYQKSRNWLKNSCSPTMKMVLEADKHLGRTDLSDMILEAELDDKHRKMLEVFTAEIADMVI